MVLDELDKVDTNSVQNWRSDDVVDFVEESNKNNNWCRVWTFLHSTHHFLVDFILFSCLLVHGIFQNVLECLNGSFNDRIVL